jgi:hypothetical protein
MREMYRAEWHKLLIKQKGIIVLSFFLLLKIIFTLTGSYDSDYIIDRNPEGYNKYITMYSGKLTEKKINEINIEADLVNNNILYYNELIMKLEEGELSNTEYEQLAIQCYEREGNYTVFGIVYNQFVYAQEDVNNRYIMDERGWNVLLTRGMIDFFLVLCLILILTPVFCNEYESNMETLLLTTQKGKYQIGIVKLMSASILAVGITLLFSMVDVILINRIIGLEGSQYPLQSLQYFENSIYHISIVKAYIFVVGCRVMGAVFIVALISLIGIISEKSIITLFVCSILILLPFLVYKGENILYYLPLPSGFLVGEGYLWGTSYTRAFRNGTMESVVQFMQISKKNFSIIILINVIIVIVAMMLSIIRYSKTGYKFRKLIRRFIGSKSLLSILLVSMLVSGCVPEEQSDEVLSASLVESVYYGETSEYVVDFDQSMQTIQAERKENGEKIELIRSPFESDMFINGIFVRDEWCYYLETDMEKEGFRIYGIDLSNFKQMLIYNSIDENTEDFYGILSSTYNEDKEDIGIRFRGFFLDDEYIYCINIFNQIIQINRNNKLEKVISLDAKGIIYFYDGDLYYSNSQKRLCIFKKKEGQAYYIDSIYTIEFSIEGTQIKYKDFLENDKMKCYDISMDKEFLLPIVN